MNYAKENGIIASVKKFKIKFSKLNESAPRTFPQKYKSELSEAKQKGRPPLKLLANSQMIHYSYHY